MPTFLTRLRSLRRSRPSSTPDRHVKSTHSEAVRREGRRDALASVEDATPESLGRDVELDSKIYPDLSALFASVEEALKCHERVAEAQEVRLYDESESDDDYGCVLFCEIFFLLTDFSADSLAPLFCRIRAFFNRSRATW